MKRAGIAIRSLASKDGRRYVARVLASKKVPAATPVPAPPAKPAPPRSAAGYQLEPDARRSECDVFWKAATDRKLVALTFDDGPRPNYSPMVYDILDEHQVRATFFLVGERVAANADLIKGRMDRHEVANHSWAHTSLSLMNRSQTLDDLGRAHEAITSVTGQEPRLFRPPFGELGGTSLVAAAQFGYDMAFWSHSVKEAKFQDDQPALVDDIIANTGPGSILLAHDSGGKSRLILLNQLDLLIKRLRAEGYEFVTVSELREAARR